MSSAGVRIDLGTPKQRALVAGLALARGRAVSVDGIVDLLWGDEPPPGSVATLQGYVSSLRRVLEPDRARRAPASVLVTVAPGYALRLPEDAIDAVRFEREVADTHARLQAVPALGESPLDTAELAAAVSVLDTALARWRGTPYSELSEAAGAVAERHRLEELRLVALEDRAVAGLALGHHRTVAAELEALTDAHPLRERLWWLRALALTRSGRQADALEALGRVREVLDVELGLEPSVELRTLQTAVLRQDPALEWVAPAAAVPTASVPVVPAPVPPPVRPAEVVAPWPMVGRSAELQLLEAALEAAEGGRARYAVLTGEPGIGKSRLAAELAALARARGAQVLVGQCSQDDGAPPLWPWRTVLQALDADVDLGEVADTGGQFRQAELVAGVLRAAATRAPTVVVLEDLHWADGATLRVLRLVAETTEAARLLVLGTWRDHPAPTGALADLAETLARRHAVRVQLGGLDRESVAGIVEGVTSARPSGELAEHLRSRTDGNPFFLVEYARLAGERADLDTLLDDEGPPTGVSEVLTRRLGRLPEETLALLRTAAVVGRAFDTPTLAGASGVDEDDVLDLVEPALVAGLVHEDGIDEFRFAHALVRDTLRSTMSASRRARAHARVAEVLASAVGRETEVAVHWRAAGPAYARRAWQAAVDAALIARALHAHDEAAALLTDALDSLDADPESTPQAQYAVLMQLVDAYRWAALLPQLVATVERAVAVAREIGDPAAVAGAAIAPTFGTLWRSAPDGEVNDTVVTALRTSLAGLPEGDSALRARVLLALANELHHRTSFADRRALVDEAFAIARRLGDDMLLVDACQVACVSLWVARTAAERLAWTTESMALAAELGEERAHLVSACLQAVAYGELGRRPEFDEAVREAREEARRLRIAYGETVLDSAEIPWLAMAGRFDRCAERLEHLARTARQISHDFADHAVVSATIAVRLWEGRCAEVVALLASWSGPAHEVPAVVTAFLLRAGREEEARAHHAEHGARVEQDTIVSLANACFAAEVALRLADAELGAACRKVLEPLADLACSFGSDLNVGPVRAYLALAAAAAGDREAATSYADRAVAQCEEWRVPLVGLWLAEARERHGF
ncbi:BTAD domain-containing putative transcriptional regulator [Nocardioides sp. W7]|uniref:BTAD domain-containing putative transcriptional regulator n=1 Tax=Nocardioides sp. W7 TaxID=2931390 RepID=UPI001FD02DED|nr:BTAD domain-containing putative transcriptional regulator [Nocardioides sp. W7]